MFKSIGTTEIIIIALVLLVLFGSRFLPKVGRNLGESEKELKKATKELKSVIKDKE